MGSRRRLAVFIGDAHSRPGDLLSHVGLGVRNAGGDHRQPARRIESLHAVLRSEPFAPKQIGHTFCAVPADAASIIRAGISSQPISSKKSGMLQVFYLRRINKPSK